MLPVSANGCDTRQSIKDANCFLPAHMSFLQASLAHRLVQYQALGQKVRCSIMGSTIQAAIMGNQEASEGSWLLGRGMEQASGEKQSPSGLRIYQRERKEMPGDLESRCGLSEMGPTSHMWLLHI